MSPYTQFTKELGELVAGLAKPAQDASVEVLGAVSGFVGDFIPELPVPDGVPTQREVVEAGFDLWEQVLGSQRDYVLRLLDAVVPITSKFEPKRGVKPKAAKTVAA